MIEMAKKKRKILIIGSGPVKIGEAAEFDYSTSQVLRVLREEGFESVLINSNVATVQTSYSLADKIYMLPVTMDFVEKITRKERPWGIMVGFGGQTALNIGVELHRKGILKKYNVKVLGTGISGINAALSRERFRKVMKRHRINIPPSISATDSRSAIKGAKIIGYPVMLRVSFNLGGRGSAVLWNENELKSALNRAFAQSYVGEVLIEKYLNGWKEIEYEVVRDSEGNSVVTACIENLDPMGTHTGESTVVTPAQTLDNYEFQEMRSVAIRVAEAIDLVGECNVQFALSPNSYDFYVIETNPRMSRSSALASKATGYPLAYISAKLALGHRLYEIKNTVSKSTTAFFEPSLDYITVKIPRWDLGKFDYASSTISTEMKSIGEVMGIGRNFEEAMQKAIRMLDVGEPGIVGGRTYNSDMSVKEIKDALKDRKPYWFLYAAKAIRAGIAVEEVQRLTGVDGFFIEKIRGMVDAYEKRGKSGARMLDRLKGMGFCDAQIGASKGNRFHIKQIDTLAGEWPAKTNYLYTTHSGEEDDINREPGLRKLLILGAGVFRIGVSVEFDYGAVTLAESAKKYFDKVAILNYNPETVSTDWDRVDKLYFDEISEESVMNINRKERFDSIATFTAGQIGNNLALSLEKKGVKLLGTKGKSIDMAENRDRFSGLLERLGIKQPGWISATTFSDIRNFIERYGFPVLVRPSYVLSGSAMKIANNMQELKEYVSAATRMSSKYPTVISSFIKNGTETELDCASDGKNVIGVSLSHIEEAGVHSGDSTIVTPYVNRDSSTKMKEIALRLVNELDIKGPFNLQFVTDNGEPLVIELNMRTSRSMPFSSKSVGANIIDYAMRGIMGKYEWNGFREPKHIAFAAKSAQFSWAQLKGAYPHLGPEMRSTGESAAFGRSMETAILRSWLGVQPNRMPSKGILVYGDREKSILKETADLLSKRFDVKTIEQAPMHNYPALDNRKVLGLMGSGAIDMLITNNDMHSIDYDIRRMAADQNIPMVLNARLGRALARAFYSKDEECNEMSSYWAKDEKALIRQR